MAWLAVDKDGAEVAFDSTVPSKPERQPHGSWTTYYDRVRLPKGLIKRLIGRELTWDDEPVEFNEVLDVPSVEQEPVITKDDNGLTLSIDFDFLPVGTKFYTNPQLREPLSKDEIVRIVNELDLEKYNYLCVARAIEKAHGIGGTKCI
jgi:hypothetical protein